MVITYNKQNSGITECTGLLQRQITESLLYCVKLVLF